MYGLSRYAVLRITRHLSAIYGNVVPSVDLSVNSKLTERGANGLKVTAEVNIALPLLDKGNLAHIQPLYNSLSSIFPPNSTSKTIPWCCL